MLQKRVIAYIIDNWPLQIALWIVFGVIIGSTGLAYLAIILGTLAYQAFLLPATGQTPGKKMQGIKVVKLDGSALTLQDAVVRAVGYWINGIFLIGWILTFWKDEGFHDKIAKTKVVEA
jgi:uncharacterized RDD family membrane protein YckC